MVTLEGGQVQEVLNRSKMFKAIYLGFGVEAFGSCPGSFVVNKTEADLVDCSTRIYHFGL